MHAEAMLLVDDHERRVARTRRLPGTARACRPRRSRSPAASRLERAAPRARGLRAGEQRQRRAPSGSNQRSKLRACCSASSSVGAITAACKPAAAARAPRRAATTVLPQPTSPCTSAPSARLGRDRARISASARLLRARSSANGSAARKRAELRRAARATATSDRSGSRRRTAAERQLMREQLFERESALRGMVARREQRGGRVRAAADATSRAPSTSDRQFEYWLRRAPARDSGCAARRADRRGSRRAVGARAGERRREPAQRACCTSVGGRVDRRERLLRARLSERVERTRTRGGRSRARRARGELRRSSARACRARDVSCCGAEK